MKPAIWTDGVRELTGRWRYNWASNRFLIVLDSKDRITGDHRRLVVAGDKPEWGKWKLSGVKP